MDSFFLSFTKIVRTIVSENRKNTGITGINTVSQEENLLIFYGEVSSSPLASKVLQIRTANLECQKSHLAILDGISAI